MAAPPHTQLTEPHALFVVDAVIDAALGFVGQNILVELERQRECGFAQRFAGSQVAVFLAGDVYGLADLPAVARNVTACSLEWAHDWLLVCISKEAPILTKCGVSGWFYALQFISI